MKRCRTGCHVCRSRRIKCDEQKPKCRNCCKHGVECTYGVRFQWILLEHPYQKEGSSSISKEVTFNKTLRLPQESLGRRRQIGQEVVNTGIFRESVIQNLPTIMIQTDFDDEDEPILSLDGPGSLDQFKKFRIIRKPNAMKFHTDLTENLEHPMGMHSPMFCPKVGVDTLQASLDLQSPDGFQLSKIQLSDNHLLIELPQPLHGSPSMIFSETSAKPFDTLNIKSTLTSSLADMTKQDFFNHFVNVTADELVPVPYEENPFYNYLPKLAASNESILELLVAYGASHMAMRIHKSDPDPYDAKIVNEYVNCCIRRLESLLKQDNESSMCLLSATILALIEVDRGNAVAWRYFMDLALKIIRSRMSSWAWDMNMEMNSVTFRLIGYMCGVGNLSYPSPKLLRIPFWPKWSGSLDYLTGFDLNLLPLYSETAELILQVNLGYSRHMRNRAIIVTKGLKILQRMNDYWLEEYNPYNEITAMCVMFQEALQIHVLRRVLEYKFGHPVVQRLVNLAMHHLETWILPGSTIQRCMTFILATLASESQVSEHRASLLIRLKHMAEAGFSYNWKICEDIRKHWESNTSLISAPETTLII